MAELKIKADSGGGTVSLKGPSTTTSNAAVQLTLPVDDGTSGQYLKTDGSGALSWSTVSAGVDGISSSADATAITIDSSERVGIGTTDPGTRRVKVEHTTDTPVQIHSTQSNCYVQLGNSSATNGYLGFETTNLTFHNNGKKAEIDTSGNLKVNAGNLVIGTSGKGIDFSATADSAGTSTSEVLADYEVGTWAPAFTNAPTISGAHGSYIKIGDMVFAYWQFSTSSDGPASHARINNLPFTSTAANPACGGTAWDYRTNSAINAHQSPGTTSLFFYHQNGTAMMGDSAEFESEEFRGCTIYQTA